MFRLIGSVDSEGNQGRKNRDSNKQRYESSIENVERSQKFQLYIPQITDFLNERQLPGIKFDDL